ARDPFAGVAMVETAEKCAAKWSIRRDEQDEVTLLRAEQYQAALADNRAFHRRFMDLPFEVPDPRFGKIATTIESDVGVQPINPDKLRALKPVRE
ncbi:hypothetical protein ACTGUZ_11375, partial [Streptococcus suis]